MITEPLTQSNTIFKDSYHQGLEIFADALGGNQKKGLEAPDNWREWLRTLFPDVVTAEFSDRHIEFWEWVWAIEPDRRPRPFIAIWARGGAKSTGAELAAIYAGANLIRPYVWYCCETQEQADKHVETIADWIESPTVSRYYPKLSERKVGKYGNPRGWRRQRLMAANGFTIDAIGLDTAVRGAKVKEARPGLIIFDDIDGKHDSPKTIKKKKDIIKTSILPSGSNELVVLGVQNLITPDSIFSQLADGRADFLHDRIVSGPYPAVEGLAYEQKPEGGYRITAGEATWAGQPIEVCEQQINEWGLSSFLQEAQHEVDAPPGGMFDHLEYRQCMRAEVPDLVRITVWVDPAVTSTDQSDSMGIQADGIGEDDIVYRLWSWEQITSPEDAIRRAVLKAIQLGADSVGVETDQGGDTWRTVYNQVCGNIAESEEYPQYPKGYPFPVFRSAKAGAGHGSKVHRASLMLADYEQGKIVHVIGTHTTLERSLNRFPLTKPFDLVDACYWSWYDLRKRKGGDAPPNDTGESRWTKPTTPQAISRWRR